MSTTRIDKTDTLKDKFLEALKNSLGIISNACKATDIHRATYYDWRNKDPEFAKRADAIQEYVGDFVEGKLLQNINSGHETSIIFYCKTKLKARGYVEKVINENTNIDTVTHKVDDSLMDIAQRFSNRMLKKKDGGSD